MGACRYSFIVIYLGTRWRWLVSSTPLPPYSLGKSPRFPLDRSLGEPQSRLWTLSRTETSNTLKGNRTQIPRLFQPVAHHYAYWATPCKILILRVDILHSLAHSLIKPGNLISSSSVLCERLFVNTHIRFNTSMSGEPSLHKISIVCLSHFLSRGSSFNGPTHCFKPPKFIIYIIYNFGAITRDIE